MSDQLERSKFAYRPEAQGIAVFDTQRSGMLRHKYGVFSDLEIRREMDQRWYVIHYMLGHLHTWVSIIEQNCNSEAIKALKKGESKIEVIESIKRRPDVSFGNNYGVVALVRTSGKILYQSPGFDLAAYENSRRAAFRPL